ncbi:enterobactin synthetase component F [Xylaria bambusicola]|uniref:enterobactin synthetase component F n=1 Tax=Xylaria bambusicola TaxID=326684 RepID=UPI002008B85B|nr:enterobactin synthetase component F [Xylaria bambusicola]KAI0514892.1 enterobactin synthetase component F [Xylaria bambusicola]
MTVIDTNKDLSALFSSQAKATPDAVALEDGSLSLTYAELEAKVDTLASRLRRRGVGRDNLVGVLLGRSADYVISCLAALRAGGAFLVLELAYPPGLLADVLDDARPTVVITHTAYVGQIKSTVPLIVLDEQESEKTEDSLPNGSSNGQAVLPEDDLERLAFVSYSSGTTGRPKGIANPHRAAVRSYDLRFGLSDLKPGDRVACNVFFVWEILRPLLRGATVVTVPDEMSYDPVALVELLRSKCITETLMTPTLLATVLGRHSNFGSRLKDLRTLWLNGEVVTTDLARRGLKALPNARLLNVYSASETHEIACGDIREMLDEEAQVVPVGPPLDPKHAYIVDEEGNRVGTGVSGELIIGGDLLARGYLNLPETTAKAFIPDPFDPIPGARMYKTGDTARMLPSGLLEITGRVGSMIKIRGYSVQPGAVEHAIVTHLAFRQCTIVPHGEGLDRQLVAYVVTDPDVTQDRPAVSIDDAGFSPSARRILSAHLAHYMIPALWIPMDELPTHEVSGKVDMKRLPSPTRARSPAKAQVDGEDTDQKITLKDIAKVWASVLNIPYETVIQQEHGFFDLGGHSLALVELITRLSGTYGFPVPLARLAGNPTLQGHLEVVRDARDGHTAAVQADLPRVLETDSILPSEFQPESTRTKRLSEAETVLLTGTTGYLGAFLLHALIETTTARIVCLVRFTDISRDSNEAAGMARVRSNLLDLGLWNDCMLERIEILPANLSRTRLGLSSEDFDDLASRIQVIIHSAATVNLVYPYAAMRGANVIGTREIVRLACKAGATVHHISTNGVLPNSVEGWDEDAMVAIKDVPEKLLDGYGQTKWVAEQLVLAAAERGLPARIYRPGTISGHSTSGSSNTYDLLNALVVESLQLGHAPNVDGWYAEMTPADFVSKAILSIADNADTKQRVVHLGDPNPLPTKELFSILGELGYPTKPLDWEAWVALWNGQRGSGSGNKIFTVDILRRGMPTIEGLKWVTVLKDTATAPLLAKSGLERPKIDIKLFETYTRHFCARGWLPRPPRRQDAASSARVTKKGPLAGRVAVVTGASSGIGAAVATALAQEGAHIAIAARRTDALESLKKKISASGVKVLVHKTDVTQKSEVESLMRETAEQLGPIDILVSCAGVMYFTMMANVHTDEWERTVDVNCKGLLHCLSSVVPGMLARESGHIVAISSDAGRKVFPGLGVYSASKFFVEATLQSLRLETAGTGLRVTSVQPGNTATELLGMSTDQEAIKKYGEPSGAKVLDADDVARSIVYALRQPAHVAVNEVLIEPRDEPI